MWRLTVACIQIIDRIASGYLFWLEGVRYVTQRRQGKEINIDKAHPFL
jgi:hypothetical protein